MPLQNFFYLRILFGSLVEVGQIKKKTGESGGTECTCMHIKDRFKPIFLSL